MGLARFRIQLAVRVGQSRTANTTLVADPREPRPLRQTVRTLQKATQSVHSLLQMHSSWLHWETCVQGVVVLSTLFSCFAQYISVFLPPLALAALTLMTHAINCPHRCLLFLFALLLTLTHPESFNQTYLITQLGNSAKKVISMPAMFL